MKLEDFLKSEIASKGSISFADFMQNCLYYPVGGYYSGGKKVVGREGDFYTNVSTGALFGRLLADGFLQVWRDLGEPDAWQIVEQGANRGDLAADVLSHLHVINEKAWQACSYIIAEPFPLLQKLQLETLRERGEVEKIRHVTALTELPEQSIRGVFFSNELPDAFPVRLVKFSQGLWREMRVARDTEKFIWLNVPCDEQLAWHIRDWQIPAVEGYCAEISTWLMDWAMEAASRLAAGLMVTIDYGGLKEELYTAERFNGTIRAYRQHKQMADLLAFAGEQDLTAHVNFSRIITGAERGGLRLQEYTDQHHYMVKLGQLRFFQEMEQAPSAKLLAEYKTLMHPVTMGTVFKVLVMERGQGGI